jgi:hypothetical protein
VLLHFLPVPSASRVMDREGYVAIIREDTESTKLGIGICNRSSLSRR